MSPGVAANDVISVWTQATTVYVVAVCDSVYVGKFSVAVTWEISSQFTNRHQVKNEIMKERELVMNEPILFNISCCLFSFAYTVMSIVILLLCFHGFVSIFEVLMIHACGRLVFVPSVCKLGVIKFALPALIRMKINLTNTNGGTSETNSILFNWIYTPAIYTVIKTRIRK